MPAQLSSVGIQAFAVFLFPRPSSSAQLCVDQHGCLMSLPSSHQTGEMEGKAPSASHGITWNLYNALLTSHWPQLSCFVTCNFKQDWETQFYPEWPCASLQVRCYVMMRGKRKMGLGLHWQPLPQSTPLATQLFVITLSFT